jgi:hypothetical protein
MAGVTKMHQNTKHGFAHHDQIVRTLFVVGTDDKETAIILLAQEFQ